jgi:hypothetical protein
MLRRTLESPAAELSSPARVVLKGPLKLSEALAAIEKQTGNRFVDCREEFDEQRPRIHHRGRNPRQAVLGSPRRCSTKPN